MFFFPGFQGTSNRQVNNATGYCIPTAFERAGDFSHMGGNCPINNANITDPISGANISATRMLTSPSEISTQAVNLVKTLPTALADQYGYVQIALPANYKEYQYIGKIDYTFSPKHSLFRRYYLTDYTTPAYHPPIHDRLALNLRLECFNLLNHPFFNIFTTTLNSGTFGYATATPADEQREFQAAAKFTF
jgi:hypothetical protein